jgi:thiol-disulfide isomerase/thioredoxin
MKKAIAFWVSCLLLIVCTRSQNNEVHVKLSDHSMSPGFKGIKYNSFNPKIHIFPVKERNAEAVTPPDFFDKKILSSFLDREQYFFQSYKVGNIDSNLFNNVHDFDTVGLSPVWIDNVLSIMTGKNNKGEDILIIDTNNDENFNNDRIYILPIQDSASKIQFAVQAKLEYYEKGKIITMNVPLVVANNNPKNKDEWYWFVNGYKTGSFTINGTTFSIALHSRPVYRVADYYRFYVDMNQDGIFDVNPAGNESYSLNKPFNIGTGNMVLDNISLDGTSIHFKKSIVSAKSKRPLINNPAPSFMVNDMKDELIGLKNFSGRYVLLDFWATWCGPCIKEIPFLKEAKEKYAQLAVLGIACNDEKDQVLAFTQRNNMVWQQSLQKLDGKLASEYRVEGLPAMFLIDPSGKIVAEGDDLRGGNLLKTLQKLIK